MTVEEALWSFLGNHPLLEGWLKDADGRIKIWPSTIPEGVTLPAIKYDRVSTTWPGRHLGGIGSVERPRITLTIAGNRLLGPNGTRTIAETILGVLPYARSVMEGLMVEGSWPDNMINSSDPETGEQITYLDIFIQAERPTIQEV